MRLAPLALALAALVALPARAAPPAVVAAAEALAADLGPPPEARRAVLLAVDARAPALAGLVESALEGALAPLGYAVTLHRGRDAAEDAARRSGQDWLLRVRAGLVPRGRDLALVGELIPTWSSFFLQRRPGARAIPPRVVQARAPADPETLLVARPGRPARAPFAVVRPLARVEGRVLAVAVGDAGEGRASVVAVTPERLVVLRPDGAVVASVDATSERAPVRDPAAAVAIGDFGGGRIAAQRAGEPLAEVLALGPERLERAGTLDAAPLCAGEAGALLGAFAPGTGVFVDRLARAGGAHAPPPLRSRRLLYGAAASPRGGPIAFAVLGVDLRLELLGPDLAPVPGLPAPGLLETGSGLALADLDGDGVAELVLSGTSPRGPDRIRILAPLAAAPLVHESQPLDGVVLAGAGGDVTGDGVDDAVLALVTGGAAATTLLLVTADAGELPR
jgi:hypothetical protein